MNNRRTTIRPHGPCCAVFILWDSHISEAKSEVGSRLSQLLSESQMLKSVVRPSRRSISSCGMSIASDVPPTSVGLIPQ